MAFMFVHIHAYPDLNGDRPMRPNVQELLVDGIQSDSSRNFNSNRTCNSNSNEIPLEYIPTISFELFSSVISFFFSFLSLNILHRDILKYLDYYLRLIVFSIYSYIGYISKRSMSFITNNIMDFYHYQLN